MGSRLAVAVAVALPLAALTVTGPARSANAADGSPQVTPVVAFSSLGPAGLDPAGNRQATGRVEDLAVDPADSHHLLALADEGLWESNDNASSWHLLPGVAAYGQHLFEHGQIKFDTAKPGVVLLTSPTDRLAPTKIGVYRSTNSGATWSQPTGYQPNCGGHVGGPSAIAFAGHQVAVAGDWCLGLSSDDGATWRWTAPGPQPGLTGVTADAAGDFYACGWDGIFKRPAGTSSAWSLVFPFTTANGWTAGTPFGECRLSTLPPSYPSGADHLFVTSRWTQRQLGGEPGSAVFEIYKDLQGGWHAQDLQGPSHNNGRDVLVTTRPSPAGASSGFDLYWHSTDLVWFEHCTVTTGFDCPVGATTDETEPDPPWQVMGNPSLHADVSEIVFDSASPYCVKFVSDDGGVQRPGSANCTGAVSNWLYANKGLATVEAYQMAMSQLSGTTARPDLYLAAQDNGVYGMQSGATAWKNVVLAGDGLSIAAQPFVDPHISGISRVFWNENGSQFKAQRGLLSGGPATAPPFVAPWSGMTGGVPQMAQIGATVYLAVQSSGDPAIATLFTSPANDMSHWAGTGVAIPAGTSGSNGPALVAVTSPHPALLLAYRGALYRITNFSTYEPDAITAAGTVGPIAAGGSSVLAISCDSGCAHLAAVTSTDGGTTWSTHPLAAAMLHSYQGQALAVGSTPWTLGVTDVAVNSITPKVMAIGTTDAGLLGTEDGGITWERWGRPFDITTLGFDNNVLYLSTFGHGVLSIHPVSHHLTISAHTTPPSHGSYGVSATIKVLRGTAPVSGVGVQLIAVDVDHRSHRIGSAVTNSAGQVVITGGRLPPGSYTLIASANRRYDINDLEGTFGLVAI